MATSLPSKCLILVSYIQTAPPTTHPQSSLSSHTQSIPDITAPRTHSPPVPKQASYPSHTINRYPEPQPSRFICSAMNAMQCMVSIPQEPSRPLKAQMSPIPPQMRGENSACCIIRYVFQVVCASFPWGPDEKEYTVLCWIQNM